MLLSRLLHIIIRVLESRTVFITVSVLFRFVLEIGYLYFVHPLYTYSGFVLEFSKLKYIESWIIFIVLLCFAPRQLRRPSDFYLLSLLLGLLVPLLSLYAFADHSRRTVYIVLLGYMLIEIIRKGRLFRLTKIRYGIYISLTIALTGALLVSAWFVVSGGLTNFNMDLTRVYEFRRTTGALINVGPMGYLNSWATKVFGPFLLAYGLLKRNYALIGLALILHVFWYGVSNHKSVLFFPFVILFLWLYFRQTRALSILPISYFSVVLIALSSFLLFGESFLGSLFIRRVFFVIANNTFDYYIFFGENQFVYWSNSITSSLLSYPYHLDPANLIGEWRGTESHVNNSFLATGFMHAGIVGVIFYGILAGILLRLIDSLIAEDIPLWFITALMIIPVRALLLNADFWTALSTHGIAVAVFLTFLARSKSV